MSAHAELLELYQEWKRLTEVEAAAIRVSDWAEVRSCQEEKQELRPKIIRATEAAKKNPDAEFDAKIRECINELILLETRNSEGLGRRLEAVEREMSELDRTTTRLKQVHKSYTGTRSAAWDQYS